MKFDPHILSDADRILALRLLQSGYGDERLRNPDLVISPCGEPYLYRWRLSPYAGEPEDLHGNCYLHVQVLSDPERPLHDHPWDNMSVILSGGYEEIYDPAPHANGGMPGSAPLRRTLRRGDVVFRTAETAHRLILLDGHAYTMTQFSTGPVRQGWGFWTPGGWVASHDTTRRAMAEGTNVSAWSDREAPAQVGRG